MSQDHPILGEKGDDLFPSPLVRGLVHSNSFALPGCTYVGVTYHGSAVQTWKWDVILLCLCGKVGHCKCRAGYQSSSLNKRKMRLRIWKDIKVSGGLGSNFLIKSISYWNKVSCLYNSPRVSLLFCGPLVFHKNSESVFFFF